MNGSQHSPRGLTVGIRIQTDFCNGSNHFYHALLSEVDSIPLNKRMKCFASCQ